MEWENRKQKQVFGVMVLKPRTTLCGLACSVPKALPGQRKKRVVRTQHLTAATSPLATQGKETRRVYVPRSHKA